MLKLRRRPASPPPVVSPGVNTRVSLLVEGVRYGGRVDDVERGALVIAAPDIQLAAERPVMLEWRDAGGVWVMPAEVVELAPAPVPDDLAAARPAPSECVSPAAAADGPVRLSGRIVESPRLPRGTRVPVTTANVDGGRARAVDDPAARARRRARHRREHRRRSPRSGPRPRDALGAAIGLLARAGRLPARRGCRSVGRRARRRRARSGRDARRSHPPELGPTGLAAGSPTSASGGSCGCVPSLTG